MGTLKCIGDLEKEGYSRKKKEGKCKERKKERQADREQKEGGMG